MTRFILRGLYHGFIAVLLYLAATQGIDGFNEYHRIVQGQVCVDTAVARGWIKP